MISLLLSTQNSKQMQGKGEPEPKSVQERHHVYTELLQMLELSHGHRNNLLERGLDLHAIERNGYRSTPNKAEAERIAETLSESYDVSGIPGFFKDSGKWRIICNEGLIIPVRDESGLIQGFQIRLNNENNGKYHWLSSRHLPCGTGAKTWLHVTGHGNKPVYLVEGALKADICAHLQNGVRYIALPGVHSQNEVIPLLQRLGVTAVTEAFDMDKIGNVNVANAVTELKIKLSEADISHKSLTWDSKLKGYDDYLLFCHWLDSAA